MGLPELEEWRLRGRSTEREEVPSVPLVLYQVYLEGGKAAGDGKWYWGLEKMRWMMGFRDTLPISTSVIPISSLTAHPDPPAPHSKTDSTPGIRTISALCELSLHRWAFVRRFAHRFRKSIWNDAAPATPPADSPPRKVVTLAADRHAHTALRLCSVRGCTNCV